MGEVNEKGGRKVIDRETASVLARVETLLPRPILALGSAGYAVAPQRVAGAGESGDGKRHQSSHRGPFRSRPLASSILTPGGSAIDRAAGGSGVIAGEEGEMGIHGGRLWREPGAGLR